MGYTLAKLMDNAGYICTRNQWICVLENIVGPIITKEQLVQTADWKGAGILDIILHGVLFINN
jgi:hypothetical protein